MDSPLTPYPYQERDIAQLISNDGTGIVATQVGGGKTLIAIETAKRLGTRVNFVIAPKGTHKRAWEKTILRQIPDTTVRYINSTEVGMKALVDLSEESPGWYLISPEFFRKFGWSKFSPDLAVFDEIHRASNRKSKTAMMLHTLKAKARMGLSGTIAGNRIEGIWSVIRWVYPEVAGRSFWNWVDRYCTTKFDPFAGKTVAGERSPGGIVSSLPCYIRHLKREKCCDNHPDGMDSELPKMQVEERTVELSPEQKRIYKAMEKDLFVWLEGNPLVAEVPVSARVRLRQITLGVPSIDEEGVVHFADDCKSTKIDEMFQIIGDLPDGEPLLILTHSQKFASVVKKRLEGAGISAFEWSGMASQRNRDDALESFIAGGVQAIVAVISAIGEGTDGLQEVCSTVIWLSKDDNRLMNEQAAGRLDRQGQKKSVLSFEILAENTYDEGQLSKLIRDQLEMNASLRSEGK
jgi:superfamily II DNA or RNA helicase